MKPLLNQTDYEYILEVWRVSKLGVLGMGVFCKRLQEKFVSPICACLFMCKHALTGQLCRLLSKGEGLSLQTCPGARQYCTMHNEGSGHKEE